jgi:hypothetical protein
MTTSSAGPVGRRGLIIGAGAAVLAAGMLSTVEPALAEAPHPKGDGTADGRVHAATSPILSTIASAPISGYTYRFVSLYDFRPFNGTSVWTWGGSGAYSAGVGSAMRASVEIPAGALVRDIEYYVYNNSGFAVEGSAYIWAPGSGVIWAIGADASIPSAGGVSAVSAVASQSGSYPFGARLHISVTTPATGLVQVNGARAGFQLGEAATGLLAAPYRAYDSRTTGGKLAAGSTRTITLPASIVPPGTTGIVANITATLADGQGYLKVFSGAAPEPSASALNYSATVPIANALTVGVSDSRQIKIKTSTGVHVIVDVTGTVA